MKRELFRKGIHTVLALFFALLALNTGKDVVLVTAGLLFVSFAILRLLRVYSRVGMVPRVTFGELFFMIGVAATAMLSLPNTNTFTLAMFILAFSDPLASLVGMRFGTNTYTVLDEKRTLEGSGMCFFVTYIILLAFAMPVFLSFCAALTLTLIESVSVRGSDNLFLPIATALLFTALV